MKGELMEERINRNWRRRVNVKIGYYLAKTGVSPNSLTVAGIFVSFSAALVIPLYGLVYGAFAMAFASLFDLLDGAVAKATNKTTNFGAFLDDVADRISEAFFFSAIFFITGGSFVVFATAVTSILVSYVKASATTRGYKITSGAILGRPLRIVLLFILMIASPWFEITSTLWLIVIINICVMILRWREIQKQGVYN
ncbi:MAG: CDP-alcohol phosphatidyltransferase family protein [bacterium]|nr:CDP-alcohol phosphatidyltransferase family protein [bacterium]